MTDLDLFGQPTPRVTPRHRRRRNLTLDVAAVALHAARLELDSYSRPRSPHVYTQPQLLAVLVLKAFLRQTYRGVVEQLDLSAELRDELGLRRVPEHSTLKRFADRLGPAVLDRVVARVLEWCRGAAAGGEGGADVAAEVAAEVAMDSTGVECTPASRHYEMRIGRARGRYVKLSMVVTCATLLLVTFVADFGPQPDHAEAPTLLWHAAGRCRPTALYADAGYDREASHAFCRAGWGVRSYVPPVARGGFGVIRSPFRSLMAARDLSDSGYGRRWHIESFISGFKRSTSASLRARRDAALLTEASLNLLAYAVRRA
jgi:hypothetical protein